jgi:hypothetical protein
VSLSAIAVVLDGGKGKNLPTGLLGDLLDFYAGRFQFDCEPGKLQGHGIVG